MVDFSRMLRESVLLKTDSWPTFDGKQLNRNDFVTASEASGCARKLAYSKTTKSVPPKDVTDDEYELLIQNMNATSSYGYFERGHAIEAWVVERLRAALIDGEMLLIAGEEQVSFYNDDLKISGTPDGVFYDPASPEELTLLEVKSTGNIPSKPKDEHILQVQINMGLMNSIASKIQNGFSKLLNCPYMPSQTITSARIIYIQSNNYMDMAQYTVEYDNGKGVKQAYEKSRKVFIGDDVHKPQNVDPEGIETGECWFCLFKRPCRMVQESQSQAVPDEGLPNMPRFQEPSAIDQSLLDHYGILHGEHDETKKALDQHKKLVMQMMEATPEYGDKVSAIAGEDEYALTIRSTERTALDKKKVASFVDAKGGNMDDLMTTTTTKPGLYMNKRK